MVIRDSWDIAEFESGAGHYLHRRSIAEGRKAGIASALGVGTGGLVHVIAATLGLSAVIATSVFAFTVVKWAGVAYLVYLGLRLLASRADSNTQGTSASGATGGITAYRRGILTSVLNPKVAFFFLAFLPHFVDCNSAYRVISFMILGGTFVFTGTIWALVIAVVSARASEGIRRSKYVGSLVRRITGGVFVGLGVKLALERPK